MWWFPATALIISNSTLRWHNPMIEDRDKQTLFTDRILNTELPTSWLSVSQTLPFFRLLFLWATSRISWNRTVFLFGKRALMRVNQSTLWATKSLCLLDTDLHMIPSSLLANKKRKCFRTTHAFILYTAWYKSRIIFFSQETVQLLTQGFALASTLQRPYKTSSCGTPVSLTLLHVISVTQFNHRLLILNTNSSWQTRVQCDPHRRTDIPCPLHNQLSAPCLVWFILSIFMSFCPSLSPKKHHGQWM